MCACVCVCMHVHACMCVVCVCVHAACVCECACVCVCVCVCVHVYVSVHVCAHLCTGGGLFRTLVLSNPQEAREPQRDPLLCIHLYIQVRYNYVSSTYPSTLMAKKVLHNSAVVVKVQKNALAGSRTRIYCLEGNNANHYTNAWLGRHYFCVVFVSILAYSHNYHSCGFISDFIARHARTWQCVCSCSYNASCSSVYWRDGQIGSFDLPHLNKRGRGRENASDARECKQLHTLLFTCTESNHWSG